MAQYAKIHGFEFEIDVSDWDDQSDAEIVSEKLLELIHSWDLRQAQDFHDVLVSEDYDSDLYQALHGLTSKIAGEILDTYVDSSPAGHNYFIHAVSAGNIDMAKIIYINAQILDGNLGDEWKNNTAAAYALAEYSRETWLRDLAAYSGYKIEIDIDVQSNTAGLSRDVCVTVEQDYEVQSAVESALTDENTLWERFCDTDAAEALAH